MLGLTDWGIMNIKSNLNPDDFAHQVKEYLSGNMESFHALVASYKFLPEAVCKIFASYSDYNRKEDMLQAAWLGLIIGIIKGVKKFDEKDLYNALGPYAFNCIRKEIFKYFESWHTIRIPNTTVSRRSEEGWCRPKMIAIDKEDPSGNNLLNALIVEEQTKENMINSDDIIKMLQLKDHEVRILHLVSDGMKHHQIARMLKLTRSRITQILSDIRRRAHDYCCG